MMIFRKRLWFFAIALPSCFVTQGYAKDVTLGWDANTEPDLAGYKVYYKTGSSGEPYNGTGADQGPSPRTLSVGSLGDPNNPAYTLTGLDDNETYYFVVTASNDEGFESDYSNEVLGTTPMNDTTPGGGGCLIATAAYGSCIAKEVVALRKFRDHKNSLGRSFEFYYEISPLIAYYTGGHETLRTAARLALTPVVYSVKYPKTSVLRFLSSIIAITLALLARRSNSL
jgi:hypothetical protein